MRRLRYTIAIAAALLFSRSTLSTAQILSDAEVKAAANGMFHPSSTKGVDEAYLPIYSPSSHASNLILLKNGDTLCFWFSGTKEGESGVSIVMSRLPRGSRQWQKTVLVHRETGRSYQNPTVFQDSTGVLWLFHSSQAANQGETNAHLLMLQSMDNGDTWSQPTVLFPKPGSFTRNNLVVADDGRWLLPIFYVPTDKADAKNTNYTAVEVSSDRGKTWSECVVPKDPIGLVQGSIVHLGKNSYRMFMRDRHGEWVYQATSTDGCNWSKPTATVLPNNNASVQAIRLKNGHVVIVFDNVSESKGESLRFPLSIALSDDEGKTWKWVRDVEAGERDYPKHAKDEFSYPSVIQERNGKIMVSYTYNRQTIKVVEFNENWIKQGATIGQYRPVLGK